MIGPGDWRRRLRATQAGAHDAGVDAVLVSPGSDLRYLCGYVAVPLERLTCLVVPAMGDPFLVVPALEVAAARASGAGDLGLELLVWQETDDPYLMTARRLGRVHAVAVDNHMWAEKALRFAAAMPSVRQSLGSEIIGPLRTRKSEAEIGALARAGAAIDAVHERMGEWLRVGRTEREIGTDIARAIIDAGHEHADFVIVGSGPNGASPHHGLSDREIEAGDAVVVDIGGTTREGYCSDETRTYSMGRPGARLRETYDVLRAAQAAAVDAVRPGITCAALDSVARDTISDAGYGEQFIHRTGHGIGMLTHEDPYIVAGNMTALEPGHAFSVEPGIYVDDHFGLRIEDIVVCGIEHGILMNHRPRELQQLP